jgi:hypothetical protein
MTSTELFAAMPPALASDIMEFNHANEMKLYRAALDAVAQARKLRRVFLERQPRAEQHAQLLACLCRPQFAVAADTLLRYWLLKKHVAMITGFLDALGIQHEEGAVADLPKTVDDTALKNAVEALLAKHPHDVLAVYLTAFNSMNGQSWPNLDALLKEDARLKVGTRDKA